MSADNFTEAAEDVAEERARAYIGSDEAARGYHSGFTDGASWGREQALSQEPDTDLATAAGAHLATVDHDKSDDWVGGFVAAITWAVKRTEQEPTDAEVEAVARSIHEHFPRKYLDEFGLACTARWEELEPHMREEYRVVARAALSAARAARRDEEKR